MADILALNADEKDISKVVAVVRQLVERFQPSEDTAAGAFQIANNLDEGVPGTIRSNIGAVNIAGDTMTGALEIGNGASSTFNEFLRLRPSDFASNVPYLTIQPGGVTGTWVISLWDGADHGGTIDIAAVNFTHNGNAIVDTSTLFGLQTIWVPAAGMVGYVGSAPGQTTYSSGNLSTVTFDFDQTTQEVVSFQITMPKSWDKGNIFFVPYWTATGGSGTVAWKFFAVAISDNEVLNASLSGTVTSTDTFQNADRLHVSPITSGLTPDGSPANDDMILIDLARDVANDTLTSDARLLGVKILYTVNAANDT